MGSFTSGDLLGDVLLRVRRRFQNEIAEDRQGTPKTARERVGRWLAGVSFDEWFMLADRLADRDNVLAEIRAGYDEFYESGNNSRLLNGEAKLRNLYPVPQRSASTKTALPSPASSPKSLSCEGTK